MKKIFRQPELSRFELKLNENIAYSWEYYYGGTIGTAFHFIHMNGEGTAVVTEEGHCFRYLTANMAWDTDTYNGPNVGLKMSTWLLDLLNPEYDAGDLNHYVQNCYTDTLPNS